MITLLSKIFIKDNQNETALRQAYGFLCGGVGIFLNLLLCAAKIFAGILSGSIAITADGFNNLSDAGASAVTLLGFKLAAQKPDQNHPFGHGRMEYISGLIVSFLILLMGYELGKSSIEKIIAPESIQFSVITIAILVASILVKLYMAFYNMQISKKINSPAIKATATDSLSDCVSTCVVLAATLINRYFHINIDAWCGILVAIFILYSGYQAAKDTISPLLGQPPSHELVEKIENILLRNPHINNFHDLIVHDYGPGRMMLSVHAEVSSEEDILAIHDSIDNTERYLAKKLGCEAVIHIDPVAVNDAQTQQLQERIRTVVEQIDLALSIHDFRIVTGNTHTNLIFDIVVPFNFSLSDGELKKRIVDRVLSFDDGNYFAVITIDHAYC